MNEKVGFYTQFLSNRGTVNALFDYAYYCKHLLEYNPIIVAWSGNKGSRDALPKFQKEFEVVFHDEPSSDDMDRVVEEHGLSWLYIIKPGFWDHVVTYKARSLIHVVFPYNEPHGSIYAYVSRWLSEFVTKGEAPFVPHMIDILRFDHSENLREKLEVPDTALVFGYYGGTDTFDIEYVKCAVMDVAKTHKDIYFLFMGILPFVSESKNIIFLNGTHDEREKIRFINTTASDTPTPT